MSLKLSNLVVAVQFVESAERGYPSANKSYHYQVPEIMLPVGGLKPNDYVIVPGQSQECCLARINEVIDASAVRTKATKAILGTVDISHHQREKERAEEREATIKALYALEAKRQRDLKFAELAANDTEAAELLAKLKSLD